MGSKVHFNLNGKTQTQARLRKQKHARKTSLECECNLRPGSSSRCAGAQKHKDMQFWMREICVTVETSHPLASKGSVIAETRATELPYK